MGYGFKVRRIRSRSNTSSPSETFYYARWKKHQERKDRIKAFSSTTRTFLLVTLCTTLNVAGILFSEASPYSILYFDTIGTAIAAIIGGLGIGSLVIFATAAAGIGITGQPEYALFSYGNALAVFVWAYFPRSGSRALGADIFENRTIYGYRHFVSRIFLLGVVTALVASASNSIFQYYLLDTIVIDGEVTAKSSFGTVATQNNLMIISENVGKMNIFSGDYSVPFFYYLISSFPSHLIDKTISTLLACVFIICLFDPPHYRNQRDRIIDRPHSDNQWWNRRLLYLAVVGILTVFCLALSKTSSLDMLILFGFGTITLIVGMAGNYGCRSIDPYRQHGRRSPLFIGSSDGKVKVPYFKDSVEDTIKITTFVFVILQFVSHAILSIYDVGPNFANSPMIDMFWYTVIVLTGFRYALMASLRGLERI